MARKSRRVPTTVENTSISTEVLTALYARKSIEDAESLETQIQLLEDYINESDDLKLYKVYSDNGFTGTNMERPALQEMLEDMKAGKFQAIIVKDGSRLGRNYLEAGTLIEITFPEYGIRFISVNDQYDSISKRAESDGFSLPFSNLVNEQYSKELSRKLSPAFHLKQTEGAYIGTFGPYGYLKSQEDRHKLVIDEETAPIVVRIFEMKSQGMGNGTIAKVLNEEGILSPFAYRYRKGMVKAEKYRDMKWKSGTIASIVVNKMYLGHMVQGVHRQSLSRREKSHLLSPDEWIIVENMHEPIISQELFDKVQEVVEQRKQSHKKACENVEHEPTVNLFRKKIYCADCGRAMEVGIARCSVRTNRYYRCKHANVTRGVGCDKRSVKKEVVEETVFETLKLYQKLFADADRKLRQYNRTLEAKKTLQKLQKEKEDLEKQRSQYLEIAGTLYDDYEEGILDIEEYEYVSKEYKRKISDCNERLQKIQEQITNYDEEFPLGKNEHTTFQKFRFTHKLTQEMVDAFVDKVLVHKDGSLTIKYRFQDEYTSVMQVLDERQVAGL